jgi:hypothetical protein
MNLLARFDIAVKDNFYNEIAIAAMKLMSLAVPARKRLS